MHLQKYENSICLANMSTPSSNMDMDTTNILNSDLKSRYDRMQENVYEKRINYPSGYGYVGSLPEVRNDNSMEIIKQQQTILAISAVAGVSLIVFGILISSSNNK
jgi:hypothetical protein